MFGEIGGYEALGKEVAEVTVGGCCVPYFACCSAFAFGPACANTWHAVPGMPMTPQL